VITSVKDWPPVPEPSRGPPSTNPLFRDDRRPHPLNQRLLHPIGHMISSDIRRSIQMLLPPTEKTLGLVTTAAIELQMGP
jgi:hypothetical protein